MNDKDRENFIKDISDQVKIMPILSLVFINKVVTEELFKRTMDMAEQATKGM